MPFGTAYYSYYVFYCISLLQVHSGAFFLAALKVFNSNAYGLLMSAVTSQCAVFSI